MGTFLTLASIGAFPWQCATEDLISRDELGEYCRTSDHGMSGAGNLPEEPIDKRVLTECTGGFVQPDSADDLSGEITAQGAALVPIALATRPEGAP